MFSGYQFQLGVFVTYHKNNSLKTLEQMSKSGFLLSRSHWSGFGIFKQKQENPNEIRMVGHYLSNTPHFLWVYRRDNPRGMLEEHEKSL